MVQQEQLTVLSDSSSSHEPTPPAATGEKSRKVNLLSMIKAFFARKFPASKRGKDSVVALTVELVVPEAFEAPPTAPDSARANGNQQHIINESCSTINGTILYRS